ncbi:MAG: flagellar biosynthesis protein FlhF [Proteobacteria bacterium]|nr:flagellar biosynthesis protein FlhF [Pseudomonadota bacterium]MBU1737646.1 flagellar biosynthesis protein FlhF [Pseudomonadota bacterium]
MQIKRFEAADTRTALEMVKKEMGEDAVILSTRTVHGISGRGRGHMEVVAAMDYDLEELSGYQSNKTAAFLPSGTPSAVFPPGKFTTKRPASSEARVLQARFNELYNKNSTLQKRGPLPGPEINRRSRPTRADIDIWRQNLIERLKITPLTCSRSQVPKVMAMVGSTGSGKTTTAAKLAAWFSIRQGLKVTLLSLDCYRIGATEQLRTYARIMRIPCEIVLREEDLDRALAKHSSQDLVIIDTAGRSPYDHKHLAEMTELFSPRTSIKPYLVVNATAKKEDLRHLAKAYQPMSPAGQIITKLDETRAYATLCQHLAETGMPISGLCTGQRVPEDYLPADLGYLSALFTKGWSAAEKSAVFSGLKTWKEN